MTLWQRIRPYLSATVRFARISYLETKSRYESTRIGLLWIPLGTLLFSAMLSIVFRHSDTVPIAMFFLYVLSGYTLWQFIQDTVTGSVNIIQNKLEFASHNNLGLLGLFFKLTVDRLFEYALNTFVLIICVLLISSDIIGAHIVLLLVLLSIIVPTSLSISYLINVLTLFFPDLSNLIKTGIRFVFFASPVFWMADGDEGVRVLLAQYNPVSFYLDISRQVFGIVPLEPVAWGKAAAVSAALGLLCVLVFRSTRGIVRNVK